MPTRKQQVPLVGSERSPIEGAREVGPANPDERLEVSVRIRSRAGKHPPLTPAAWAQPLDKRKLLTRDALERKHGADPADIRKIEAFAREHGLSVVEASAARRTVVLSGTVSAMNAAFAVELKQFEYANGTYRGRTGPVHIPAALKETIEGVFGLDNRPQAKPHFRRHKGGSGVRAHAASVSYTPLQVANAYNFPSGVNGSGECIALIELGGGYKPADLSSYFKQLNLSTVPTVSAVSVDHGKNQPTGSPDGPDGEVMLDIEVAGAVAPGAKIVVYFAPNTDAGFLDAITTAIHDKTNQPTVLSISWGGPESSWTSQAMTAMDEAFQAAAAVGITVCCAAGDDGSTDGVNDGLQHVDFPASSPNALACGGTRLMASGNTISSETVWNELANNEGATGGGISDFFALPTFQAGANVPPSANPGGQVGRGVPDVAGDADPTTGYVTRVDGQPDVIGGTSAVAPLWAGLIACINQKLKTPVGYANPLLYGEAASAKAFHDITSGNNGAYSAGPGWDACSGLGTPIGAAILSALAPSQTQARKRGK